MEENHLAVTEALALAIAARVPVLIWGAPGTGKTAAVRQLAKRAGLRCETVIASIREPSDFAGLPLISREDGHAHVELAPPLWTRHLAGAGEGLVFFDEISTAPRQSRPPCSGSCWKGRSATSSFHQG